MASPHKVICPRCGVALNTAGLPPGQKFRCPKCKQAITPATASEEVTQFLAPAAVSAAHANPAPAAAAATPPAAPAATAIQTRPPSPAPQAAPAPAQSVRAGTPPVVRAGTVAPAPAARSTSNVSSPKSKSRKPLIFGGAGALVVVVVGVVFLIRGWGGRSVPGPAPVPPDPFVPFVPKIDPATGLPNFPQDEPIVAWGPAKPLDYKKPIVLRGHRPGTAVVHLAYSPDGTKLASASDHGEFILWNLATGQGRVVSRDDTLRDELQRPPRLIEDDQVAFSADGKMLFTNSYRGASAWDAGTLFGRARFRDHALDFAMQALIASPSGTTLVTERPAADRAKGYGFTIWDVANQKALFKITVDERDFGDVGHLCRYSPDGRFLAVCRIATVDALAQSAVSIFDLQVNKELPSIPLPASVGKELSKIPLDARFLSSNRLAVWEGKRCSVWQIGDGAARPEALQPDVLTALAKEEVTFRFLPKPLSKDGKIMAYIAYDKLPGDATPSLVLHDTATLKAMVSIAGKSTGDFKAIALSADRKSIQATVELEQEEYDDFAWIRDFNAATGELRGVLKFPMDRDRKNNSSQKGNQAVLAASPTQPGTVTAGLDDGVIVIAPLGENAVTLPKGWTLTPQSPEVQRGDVQLITTAPDMVVPLQAKKKAEFPANDDGSLALARDASLLLARNNEGVRVWDLKSGKERVSAANVDNSTFGVHLQFTPDNRFIIDELPVAIDVDSGKAFKAPDELPRGCVTLTPDGKKLLVGGQHGQGLSSKILNLLALPSLTVERSTLDLIEGTVTAIKFSNDGKHLAAALHHQGNMKLLMLSPSTGEIVKTLEQVESRNPGHSILDFSSDSTILGCTLGHAGVSGARLTLWEWPAGKLRHKLGVSDSTAVLLANGRLVALSGLWGETTVYDTATGNVRSHLDPFELHEPKASASQLCRARNRLAIGYEDGEVIVFDVARHGKIVKFTAHPAEIVGITLSLDGNTLVTAGKDNKIRVWSLER